MEIRIYRSLEQFTNGKPIYCARVECPDTFLYSDTVDVFRTIYGPQVVIVVISA